MANLKSAAENAFNEAQATFGKRKSTLTNTLREATNKLENAKTENLNAIKVIDAGIQDAIKVDNALAAEKTTNENDINAQIATAMGQYKALVK